MTAKKTKYLPVIGLVVVALIWGLGFPIIKIVSESFPTFYTTGIRFGLSALLVGALHWKKLRLLTWPILKNGVILSLLLFGVYGFSTLGIQYTSASKASFYSGLGVFIVPIVQRLLYKTKIELKTVVCVLSCTIGVFLMSYSPGMGLSFAAGDIICLGCSLCGAFHIVYLSEKMKEQDFILLTILQFAFIAVFSFAIALPVETFPAAPTARSVFWLLFLAVVSTAVGILLQSYCQKQVGALRTGLILVLEPVSGAAFSALLLGDILGASGIAGGLLITG
ncbi:DMT family transporter, partial [Oscillospiraceae bacterium OttesenSCG-928-G22]|nr:DMT family transporter [Oscillospiraceae bacterium OttesenSCG-928-G22]